MPDLQLVAELNRKRYRFKLALDGATSDYLSFEARLEQFGVAWDMYPAGTLERDQLVRQYPLMTNMLRMNRAEVSA